jgi:hypothetical protein
MIMEHTKLRIELNAPTKLLVDAIEKNKDAISNLIQLGVKGAVENFDFEKEIRELVTAEMKEQIDHAIAWGKLSRLVRQRVSIEMKKALDVELNKIKIEIR